jgi:hypothetical protein
MGAGSIGIGQLKAATGAASATDVTFDVTMNDFAFAASHTYLTGGGIYTLGAIPMGDPGNTISRVRMIFDGLGATNVGVVRWRYITASDDPRVWIAHDAAGKIVAVWVSDDPTGDDSAPPILPLMPALTVRRLVSADLAGLGLPPAGLVAADRLIAAMGTRPAHRHFRALQLLTGDPAPSSWILQNCAVNPLGGAIRLKSGVTITLPPEILAEAQGSAPPASMWQRLRDWLGV